MYLLSTAQTGEKATHFLRFSIENDGINAWLQGTDWGYTNGLSINCFRVAEKKNRKLHQKIRRFSPAFTVTGWGIKQIMITPQKTKPAIPDKNDYPYAGALLVNHTRHKADPLRSVNLAMTWTAGWMGPPSFAEEAQVFLHRIIGDPRPNGWSYQLPTDLLLNYNITYEKKLAGKQKAIIIAGASGYAGTCTNGLSLFSIWRFQKNLDYFSGWQRQSLTTANKRAGFVFHIRPSVDWIPYYALLDGGLFNRHSPLNDDQATSGSLLHRKKIQARLETGIQVSLRKWSFSFTQQFFTPDYPNYAGHKVGALSLLYGW